MKTTATMAGRVVTAADVQLDRFEIRAFISNAQLALLENIEDKDIPKLRYYTDKLFSVIQESSLTDLQLATVLVSTAWKIYERSEKK